MLKLLCDSEYFITVIEALSSCLKKCGIVHGIANRIDYFDDSTYVLFTCHEGYPLPTNFIVYNFEQLCTDKVWPDELFERFKLAKHVIDYSKRNIVVLKMKGIDAHFLPLGYHTSMEKVTSKDFSELDFIFTGMYNERRCRYLDILEQLYYKYFNRLEFVQHGCFGDDLIELYSRTKAALNLHYFERGCILEVVRILPLIANGVVVCSERSEDKFYDNALSNVVDFFDEKSYATVCLEYRDKTPREMNDITKARKKYLRKNFNYYDFVHEKRHLFLT